MTKDHAVLNDPVHLGMEKTLSPAGGVKEFLVIYRLCVILVIAEGGFCLI